MECSKTVMESERGTERLCVRERGRDGGWAEGES